VPRKDGRKEGMKEVKEGRTKEERKEAKEGRSIRQPDTNEDTKEERKKKEMNDGKMIRVWREDALKKEEMKDR
jgi:hypothetical protein